MEAARHSHAAKRHPSLAQHALEHRLIRIIDQSDEPHGIAKRAAGLRDVDAFATGTRRQTTTGSTRRRPDRVGLRDHIDRRIETSDRDHVRSMP